MSATGTRNELELFKAVLAYLILRETPLTTSAALVVVDDVMGSHGPEIITAASALNIINEVMGAAHAAADRMKAGRAR